MPRTPFPPQVGESPREYYVRIARHFGATRCADELAALPPDDERVKQLNALPPLNRPPDRPFPNPDALRLLREFPDTSADTLLRTILAIETGAAIDADAADLLGDD